MKRGGKIFIQEVIKVILEDIKEDPNKFGGQPCS